MLHGSFRSHGFRSCFLLLLVCCLLLPVLAGPGALAAHTEYVRNPSGRTVNVRRGPGKGFTVDAELKPGTKVTVESIDGKWTRISAPVSGYMMSRYLTDNAPAGAAGGVIASTMTRYITSPNGGKVNVRTGPGLGYGVGTQLSPGTEVSLLSTSKGWSAISYNGFTVYVMSKYLTSYAPGTEPASPAAFKSFSAKIYSANGKSVNFRIKADKDADRIAQLPIWTNVTVIGASGAWYKVTWGGATGYIMKEFVRPN